MQVKGAYLVTFKVQVDVLPLLPFLLFLFRTHCHYYTLSRIDSGCHGARAFLHGRNPKCRNGHNKRKYRTSLFISNARDVGIIILIILLSTLHHNPMQTLYSIPSRKFEKFSHYKISGSFL